ncbi:xanthine dehydrogenase family protein molybdopterin-binding subunit [Jannaschia marina]|uniref:xanthine dehydrogenase family protein molybdopterin-binding subunit n=1 Tax=Jannaschia marina TaxID=2741674 RepID=UPI0015CDF4F1|nr:molybdopterin cofactor-binding domain-containing protein [Jannaschia marina]
MTEDTEQKSPSRLGKWTRRTILASAGLIGGGLAIGTVLAPNRLAMASDDAAEAGEVVLNTWVKITPDNRVVAMVPHSEMGQGANTGLAQMLAEEMNADWSLVSVVEAPVDDAHINSDMARGWVLGEAAWIPGFMYPLIDFGFLKIADGLVNQITGGSASIRLTGWHGIRRAGAAAREMLVAAAAGEWTVDPGDLTVADSTITHAGSGRSGTFGDFAAQAAAFTPSLKPDLKARGDYRIVGTSRPRLDLPGKVDGTAKFGMDVTLLDMRYAAIAFPPVIGEEVVSVDDALALERAGVETVVDLGDAVAVVADSYWTASQAIYDLDIEWTGGLAGLTTAEIFATHQDDLDGKERDVMVEEGDAPGTLDEDAVSAEYTVPYLAHATMEPMNGTAWVRDDLCDIWIGHQDPLRAKKALIDLLGLPPEAITVHNQFMGGGFGRRGRLDFVTYPVRIAQAAGMPVKTIWSREQDMMNDTYRPAVTGRMRGAVSDGRLAAVAHAYIDAETGMPDSEGPFAFQYEVPNLLIERVKCPSPVSVGFWRSVDFTQLAFFNESFMDEMAHSAGADPLDFRLAHTSDPRRRAVLERLKAEAGWSPRPEPGRGMGVALVSSFETVVGQIVDVSVSEDGEVRVNRVTSVADAGLRVNPDACEAQIQGSVIFGLTAALFGQITVENGEVYQQNFPDYEMLRLANAPRQTVYFIDSDHAPGGLGEPGVPPVAPALTNAIFAATGTRIRDLPIEKAGFTAA